MQVPEVAAGIDPLDTFVDDAWFASVLKMKPATIRSQRWKRRHGQPHWLEIDPVMIGVKPRYRRSDALAWLRNRVPAANEAANNQALYRKPELR
jgi:hypothetical protein